MTDKVIHRVTLPVTKERAPTVKNFVKTRIHHDHDSLQRVSPDAADEPHPRGYHRHTISHIPKFTKQSWPIPQGGIVTIVMDPRTQFIDGTLMKPHHLAFRGALVQINIYPRHPKTLMG